MKTQFDRPSGGHVPIDQDTLDELAASGSSWQEVLVMLMLSAVGALVVWCWAQPDVVLVQAGEEARAELVQGLEQRQRECAHSSLRSAYARGEPTPAEVDAAYAECDFAAGWR